MSTNRLGRCGPVGVVDIGPANRYNRAVIRSRLRSHTLDRLVAVKQVIAIVKPFLVERILEVLRLAPLEACSIREVKGFGRQKAYLESYTDTEYSLAFLPKVEITLWVDDSRASQVVRKIVEVARTGRMGDGKIFVLAAESFETVIDIETGQAGE